MAEKKQYLVGMFDDDHVLLKAVENVRAAGHHITDVFTPFPVHGLEHKMGLRETKLHTAGFLFGATGTLTALSFMTWVSVKNYPNVFGGKPLFALPAWIPITFELTVLFACVGMVVSFYYLCGMYPGFEPKIIDKRTTDHMFAMTFELDGSREDGFVNSVTSLLEENGAVEVYKKEV
ncbi:MAG: DUF3341 domain-containing protein [Bacteroidetes bacterium]|nr:DUF3341 domain-containing protein [Bacteroidota bacterium]